MRALIPNCTLKRSPEPSNTQRLADVVAAELARSDVDVESIRVVDQRVEPGVETDMGDRVLERMDAMLSETDDQDRPVAYNKVAGAVVTGNEDGAHHVINEICGGLNEIGFTIPGQAWTYWNMGPGPGPDYAETDHGHEFSARTAATMAANLVAVASALARQPIPA